MTKQIPKNQNKEWSKEDVDKLKHMAKTGKVTGIMAYELGRSVPAVRSKASEIKTSLHPTNKSPNKKLKP